MADSPEATFDPPTNLIIERIDDHFTFVAASRPMMNIRSELTALAAEDVPVLIMGPSGSGKEVIARLIHQLSSRCQGPLVKVNCAALTEDVLRHKLFGVERSAQTGRCDTGALELACHGTLLLAEVEAISPELRSLILNVLRGGEFTRIGGESKLRARCRLVNSVTLGGETVQGAPSLIHMFRDANATVISVPALRERREDIVALLQFYFHEFSMLHGRECPPLSGTLRRQAVEYSWPGNVRELKNYALRYVVIGEHSLPTPGPDVAARSSSDRRTGDAGADAQPETDTVSEKVQLLEALQRTHWNRRRAANALDISYTCLLSRIRKYCVEDSSSGDEPV